MEPEAILNLFDSSWFYPQIFDINQSKTLISEQNPNPQNQIEENSSKSDQLVTNFNTPKKPNLQTILSEKEINFLEITKIPPELDRPRKGHNRQKKKFSKSLSELEFEEMKGFMDLGFVFSEADKEDSRLVEIIPGLQKLGPMGRGDGLHGPRARPYLSEAWEVESPIIKWRFPVVGNEIDMKDNLKWWAHTVASAVR